MQGLELLVGPCGRHVVGQGRVAERAGVVDERAPVELGQEASQEVEVLLGGLDDELDVRKRKGEVVLGAVA